MLTRTAALGMMPGNAARNHNSLSVHLNEQQSST